MGSQRRSAPPSSPGRQKPDDDWADLLAWDDDALEESVADNGSQPPAPVTATKRCEPLPESEAEEELSVRPSELVDAGSASPERQVSVALSVQPDDILAVNSMPAEELPLESTETVRHSGAEAHEEPPFPIEPIARHKLRNPSFPASAPVPSLEEILPADPSGENDWIPADPRFSHTSSKPGSYPIPDGDVHNSEPLLEWDNQSSHSFNEPSIMPSLRAQQLSTPDDLASLDRVQDLYTTGDFALALEVAEDLLERDPYNFEARRYVESCREVLEKVYTARLAPLRRPVMALVSLAQLPRLSLDHRAGFILSLVDGTSTIEDILDLSAMRRLDALRILCELVAQKVVRLG